MKFKYYTAKKNGIQICKTFSCFLVHYQNICFCIRIKELNPTITKQDY